MNFSLSILDLAPIPSGSTATKSLQNTVQLAQLADKLGYKRFWLAEHHGMPSIASSSPEILIEHVASATQNIRVGSGGIMLPNHAPLRIAEAFHTLEALHPGRIDLGIGRAPGTDPATYRALRPLDPEHFPALLTEMIGLSKGDYPDDHPLHAVKVVPDDVQLPPIWLLGSSGASASFAGSLGLGYGFASHFSPASPLPALRAYRDNFTPSEQFEKPHVIVAIAAVCADTVDEAEELAKTMDLVWVQLGRGERSRLPSPKEATDYPYTPAEREMIQARRSLLISGDQEKVKSQIETLVNQTQADEIMISSMIHDPRARLRSYELIKEAFSDSK